MHVRKVMVKLPEEIKSKVRRCKNDVIMSKFIGVARCQNMINVSHPLLLSVADRMVAAFIPSSIVYVVYMAACQVPLETFPHASLESDTDSPPAQQRKFICLCACLVFTSHINLLQAYLLYLSSLVLSYAPLQLAFSLSLT